MLKRILLLLTALLLSACEKPTPFESAEALAEDPERLKELRLQCWDNREKLGEAQCNAVGDAERICFMGKGTPYTPHSALRTPHSTKFFHSDTEKWRASCEQDCWGLRISRTPYLRGSRKDSAGEVSLHAKAALDLLGSPPQPITTG